jgi:transposase-like protein
MENLITLAAKIPTGAAAWKYREKRRWQGKPVCPHCGVIDGHYLLRAKGKTTTGRKSYRRVWKCCSCRKQFSVLIGTVMEATKVPIRTWLFVLMEMCASKNGIAAGEVQRKYGLTPKTAWFLTQRIREVMVEKSPEPMEGTIVADEAYIGGKSRHKHGTLGARNEKYIPKKAIVFTLIGRESGRAQSRVVPDVTSASLANAILEQVDMNDSRLYTDESKSYDMVGRWFCHGHEAVYHAMHEYVRGDVTTNPAESYFSQLKRSIDGTFHALSHEHLNRYLAEFDFRHTARKATDAHRVEMLFDRFAGRRLTYRDLVGAE